MATLSLGHSPRCGNQIASTAAERDQSGLQITGDGQSGDGEDGDPGEMREPADIAETAATQPAGEPAQHRVSQSGECRQNERATDDQRQQVLIRRKSRRNSCGTGRDAGDSKA